MTRKQPTANAQAFHRKHPLCWMCKFLGALKVWPAELHHIAGRGRRHDVRANYSALCQRHHQALQSLKDSEVVCLVLKRQYDRSHYDPELICELRGWSTAFIAEADVHRCERIMGIMREVTRC